MKDSYAALHCHSTYSMMDGIGSIDKWVKAAKDKNLAGLAITDHGDASSMLELYTYGKEKGLPVVLGCEFYFTLTQEKEKDDKYSHIILWAKNFEGYKNICRLSHLSYQKENFYYKPRITLDNLREHADGLMLGTACAGGPISAYRTDSEAEYYLEKFLEIFAKEDIYLEIQHASLNKRWDSDKKAFIETKGDCVQKLSNLRYLEYAKKYGLKIIATPDAHMINKSLKIVQDIQIKNLYKNDFHFNETYYLPTRQEFFELLKTKHAYLTDEIINEALDNTYEVLEKAQNLSLDFAYNLPDTEGDYNKIIEKIVQKKIIDLRNPIYRERLISEIKIIADNGVINLLPYFSLLEDLVSWCEKSGILVGPGRGSAAGCLLNYALGITKIDPIKYNLPFSRFLNLARINKGAFPDIDLDFSDQQAAKDYLVHKYGKDHVFPISVNQTLKIRSAIKDTIRVLDPEVTAQQVNLITKKFPYEAGSDDAEIIKDVLTKDVGLRDYFTVKRPDVLSAFVNLLGQVRQRGVHPAAVVVAKDNIYDVVPVCKNKVNGDYITQYTMKWCEKAGLIKYDILSLTTLKDILGVTKFIKDTQGKEINPYKDIEMDDPKVLRQFELAETDTVFQFNSDLIKGILAQMKVRSLHDLATITAIGRPGPMDMGMHESYVKRTRGSENITYIHPVLEPILNTTYGIMVYQEQVMEAVRILGGFNADEADEVRRAMGKKIATLIDQYKDRFIKYATENYPDINLQRAVEIWGLIESFAGYGFNAAHAYSYATIAYICMWFKTYYPLEWWASVVSNENDTKKICSYHKNNEDIFVLPNINESTDKCTIKNGKIVMPLTFVMKVGGKAVTDIMKKRPFMSLKDFYERVDRRVVNKGVVLNLIWGGAIDCIGGDKGEKNLAFEYYTLYAYDKSPKEKTEIFKEYEQEVANMNRFQVLQKKAEACPIYEPNYTKHFKDYFTNEKLTPISRLNTAIGGSAVTVGGVIDSYRVKPTKKKEDMAFIDLMNDNEVVTLTAFPSVYKAYSKQIKDKELVEVSGTVNYWQGKMSIVINNMKFLTTDN